jgi:ABC-2 type transport system ATP-binding protein
MAALEIRGLERRFGRVRAVADVSLTVERGQVYGLLGPNGSGKTTTLACALGLLRPTRGEVRILGESSRAIHRLRGRVGAVFDTDCLLGGMTVRANLEYARRLLGHRGGRTPDQALDLMDVTDLAGRRASKLSLGQKKRVAVARALLGSPELLILDEPLSALDTLGARAMLRLIRRLSGEGLTLIVSSHRLHEMETVITHAGILGAGRVLRSGSLDELLGANRGRYRLRFSAQAHVDPVDGVLDALGGIEKLERRESADGLDLLIRLDGRPIEAVNRALVEAGCSVSALIPEKNDLQSLFEALVEGSGKAAS